MAKTEQFLREAFAGESQANRKYLAFAAKADQEGYPQAARLFRAAAEAETVHAHAHLRAPERYPLHQRKPRGGCQREKPTNSRRCIPEMIEAAKAEGQKAAERSFDYANSVEKIHAQLYQNLLDTLGKTTESYPYYVCPVCGLTAEKEAPGTCPVCGAKGQVFKKVD